MGKLIPFWKATILQSSVVIICQYSLSIISVTCQYFSFSGKTTVIIATVTSYTFEYKQLEH